MKSGAGPKEQGFRDLLIVIIEHIRLLVIAPLAVGVIAIATAFLEAPTYTSEAILSLAENTSRPAALIMTSPLVIDAVIAKLDLAKVAPREQVPHQLIAQIQTKVSRDGMLRLQVGAASPTHAQLLANTVIDAWRATTVPGTQEQEQLSARLAYVQRSLRSIDQLLARVTSESSAVSDGAATRGDAGPTFLPLGELQAKYFAEAQAIAHALQGVSRDVIRQQPSLPGRPDPAGKSSLAILMAIATFLLLLIAVLLKHQITCYLQDADNAASLARLRAALRRNAKPADSTPVTPGS